MTANDVSMLVVRAATPSSEATAAFEDLVRHFQEMAVATACSVLHDRALSEDAAQDAFLVAWLNLDRLRHPEAFPGWFRRIVLSQCSRRLRSTRPVERLDVAALVPSSANGPEQHTEEAELRVRLRRLLEELPEHERLPVLLFYAGDYSQKEVAAFLDVSVTTVKQRLYSARRKLRRRITTAMQDDLRDLRPPQSDSFLQRLRARLRAFETDDYGGLATLANALNPDSAGNAEWLQNRRVAEALGLERLAYVVQHSDTGEVLAFGAIEQDPSTAEERLTMVTAAPWAPAGSGRYRLFLVGPRYAGASGAFNALYERLMEDVAHLGMAQLWVRSFAGDPVLEFLADKGFVELNRTAQWRLPIDAGGSGTARTQDDVEITTLAIERDAKPGYLKDLGAFWACPAAGAVPAEPGRPYDAAYIARRLAMPDIHPDSYLIAKRGAQVAGVLNVRRPHPAVPAVARIWLSVLAPESNSSLPERLLAEATARAAEQGIGALEVVLETAFESAVQLYERLGFEKQDEMVLMAKKLAAPSVGADAPLA